MVNRINIKKSKLSTCRHFAESFSEIILSHARRYGEIRVVFDRYDENSLKSQTRCSGIDGIVPVQYRVIDTTQIGRLDVREFLASIHTKNELTEFRSRKLSVAFTYGSTKYAIFYGNTTLTNIPNFRRDLMTYGHE